MCRAHTGFKTGNIKGLTTASGLWSTAAIGLAAGGGMYFAAGVTTAIALLILYGVQKLQQLFSNPQKFTKIVAELHSHEAANRVYTLLSTYQCSEIKIRRKGKRWMVSVRLSATKDLQNEIVSEVIEIDSNVKISTS